MRVPRLLWPALIPLLLGIPVAATLLQRVPNDVDVEIVDAPTEWRIDTVNFGLTYEPDGVKRAWIILWQQRPERLARHQEIGLTIATYGAQAKLIAGQLSIRGTDCVYETKPGSSIENNAILTFIRGTGCVPLSSAAANGQVDLTVTYRGSSALGLVAHWAPPGMYKPEWMALTDPVAAPSDPVAVVDGRFTDHLKGPTRNRAALLASMWQVSDSSAWIWGLVGGALVLLLAAGVTLLRNDGPRGVVDAIRVASGVAAFALALALLYVAIVPPLQAPDEPDHMLGFANIAGRPDLAEGTAALARTSHFDRIRFHGDERFRLSDVGNPAAVAWGTEVFAQDAAARSATTWLWWKSLVPLVRPNGASGTLLSLRLANAMLFGLSAGIATALILIGAGRSTAVPQAVPLALLLVPTLPFFAVHVSDFAVLVSSYVLLSAVVAALVIDGEGTHLMGLPFGVAVALVFGGGRSGLPLAAVFAAVAAGRALVGSRAAEDGATRLRHSSVFWIGLGVGLAMFEWLSTPAFRNGLWPGDAGSPPEPFKTAAELLRVHPACVFLAAPAGLVIELATGWIRSRVGQPGRLLTGAIRWLAFGAAASIVTSLALSLFLRYPLLDIVERTPALSARNYARRVFEVVLSGFRLSDHDLLLSSSFWSGFGWIDTLPGDGYVSVLTLLAAAAAIGLLVYIARGGRVRQGVWLSMLAGGWMATLALYAVSSYYLHRNLLGRYLVGFYLTMIAVSLISVTVHPRLKTSVRSWYEGCNREWLLMAAGCGIHAWALVVILRRYF